MNGVFAERQMEKIYPNDFRMHWVYLEMLEKKIASLCSAQVTFNNDVCGFLEFEGKESVLC